MIDSVKFQIMEQGLISRLFKNKNFEVNSKSNYFYHSLKHLEYKNSLQLKFRILRKDSVIIGFHHLEIIINPHHHHNDYSHNGNDLSTQDSISSIKSILEILDIKENEYEELKVVNLEFGVNITLDRNTQDVIDGLQYFDKKKFKKVKFKHFKKSKTSKHMRIKVYGKGLQFINQPQFGIDINTLRYEIKSKRSSYINTLGVNTVKELLKETTYKVLAEKLVAGWKRILLINRNIDLNLYEKNAAAKLQMLTKSRYWLESVKKHKNHFNNSKKNYYSLISANDNIHLNIGKLIFEKLQKLTSKATNEICHSTIKSHRKLYIGKGTNGTYKEELSLKSHTNLNLFVIGCLTLITSRINYLLGFNQSRIFIALFQHPP